MEITLIKKPKSPILIHGFPGVGLVGTIASEFLLDHLKVERIGTIMAEEMPAVVAVHQGTLVEPFGIFHDKKHNLVILHAVASTQGYEWKLASVVLDLAKRVGAREIISIEGIASTKAEVKVHHFSTDAKTGKAFSAAGVPKLEEGIIMGVTGAMLLKGHLPFTCLFAETHSQMPDSKAAAKIIEVLDKYLKLAVDYKPLLAQAETFEKKLQNMMKKGAEAQDMAEKKRMNYVG